jgi:hypothetical protein
MSDVERTARARLDQHLVFDEEIVRGLLADIDMLREMVKNDPDKWSFDALLYIGRRMLAEIYPERIFNGVSTDSGPQYVVALREAIRRIDEMERTRETYNAAGVPCKESR